jgi:hypothetical protein
MECYGRSQDGVNQRRRPRNRMEAAPEEERTYARAGFITAGRKLWISLR